ncbi:hypothetical protein D9M68_500370 [compost metagenome]
MACSTAGGPSSARRSCRLPPVSAALIGVVTLSSIGPVSRPASICITVTPLSASPASTARWIGAAPRQRGSSEAWLLMQPRRGMSSTACGRISP